MLEKEWSWNLSKMVSWSWFIPLFVSCSKGGKHDVVIGGRSFQNKFKCAWKGSEPKLINSIASKKKGRKSNKNLEAMTNATNIQLPK